MKKIILIISLIPSVVFAQNYGAQSATSAFLKGLAAGVNEGVTGIPAQDTLNQIQQQQYMNQLLEQQRLQNQLLQQQLNQQRSEELRKLLTPPEGIQQHQYRPSNNFRLRTNCIKTGNITTCY